jgi:hypothetical protein
MKFHILQEERVGPDNHVLTIRLEPETEVEKKAIMDFKIPDDNASQASQIITDSLLFGLNGWQVLKILSNHGSILTVTAARVRI